ncbi:DUF2062 domain-containing protein [Chroogloeocystis siderophila]|uniref:DUF2062 domain-containing protein n=1 Tax=Chroogloeocystis siderophila 5.2 s.c.1 TaxID=247279 RepID=A0A1U7HKX6_9CHRO|nr:DUF2062 domain-containing protein [Chroogloeocystis siderophila]OKH24243.1 hypothetical protein NIES1031_15720 [Chroogloeocystis siderophila 5.2 s.c.1]
MKRYKIAPKIKKFKRHWQQQIHHWFWRILNLRGTPQYIARGLAAGIFAGLFPLFGFQTLISIALATLFKGNKLMAAAGTWISNPLTYIPIFLFNFQVGRRLVGNQDLVFTSESVASWQQFLEVGIEIIFVLFVGCFVVGLVCAIASYYICIILVQHLRHHTIKQPYQTNSHHNETLSYCSKYYTKKIKSSDSRTTHEDGQSL